MEVAIPLVALGGLYVIRNQQTTDNESGQQNSNEGYTNMTSKIKEEPRELPNVDIPVQNYPVENKYEMNNSINNYPRANATTDKYFSQNRFEEAVEHGVHANSNNYSLTGEKIDKDKFKHNNMVPWYGRQLRGRSADSDTHESILDNMQGGGSQTFSKRETAPLFKPEANQQWTYGTPNMSDFMQSRVNPSKNMAYQQPWNKESIAPGLNKGYSTSGSGGFNSGMESRDEWLPKTVDELRVATNPKVTYGLANHEGPASFFNPTCTNVTTQAPVEKHLPDSYYMNTPDRWFTTTGIEKAPTGRPIEAFLEKDENRITTTTEYYGADKTVGAEATYTVPKHEQPHRPQLAANPIINPHAREKHVSSDADHGRKGFSVLPNNRHTTCNQTFMGGINGAMKAVIAPIMDVLRPTRKEEVIGNMRPTGDAGTSVPASYVYNPADRAPTTIRETTEKNPFHMNVERQINGGYMTEPHQPISNQRDTTGCSFIGNAGNTAVTSNATLYDAGYNVQTNATKEKISYGQTNPGGIKLFNSTENIKIDKKDSDRNNNRWWVPTNAPPAIPSKEITGSQIGKQEYRQPNCERNNPSVLEAFKQNPYTHSLHSAV